MSEQHDELTAEQQRYADIEDQLAALRAYAHEKGWTGQLTRDVISAGMAAASVLRPGSVTVVDSLDGLMTAGEARQLKDLPPAR